MGGSGQNNLVVNIFLWLIYLYYIESKGSDIYNAYTSSGTIRIGNLAS